MNKFFALVLSTAILASCSITSQNLKTGEPLTVNEGILVTNCKTPNSLDRYITILPESYQFKWATYPPAVNCSQDGILAAIKLEAGNYYIGTVPLEHLRKADYYKKVLPKVTIQPNKINYIGDLRIAVRETNIITGLLVGFKQPKVSVSALDRRQETLQRLKDERPDIADKYPVVYSIVGEK